MKNFWQHYGATKWEFRLKSLKRRILLALSGIKKREMRCSFKLYHGIVQSFLKEDTFRSTRISSMLDFHTSDDLGSYSDALSHGFPKQWQRQPSDSALLSKGLLLSWRQCFPIFSRGLSSQLMEEKCLRAGPYQPEVPEGSRPWSSLWCPSLSTSAPALKFGTKLAAESGYKTGGAGQTKNMWQHVALHKHLWRGHSSL